MSFSVSIPKKDGDILEWAGTNIDSLFAQRQNIISPSFLKMVKDIIKFNRLCTDLAVDKKLDQLELSVGDFLNKHRFSEQFRDWYFLPMVGAIWSCPVAQMLNFPISTMIRFCFNHGLIQISNRPQWLTVQGGSREYVKRIVTHIENHGAQLKRSQVKSVIRKNNSVEVITANESNTFDHVVMACHSDQALKVLLDAQQDEIDILGSIHYQDNRAVLHTDSSVLPENKKCWSAWNYTSTQNENLQDQQVCVNYLINKLQPLPTAWGDQAVIVSLNPVQEPDKNKVRADIQYAHPIFDEAAIKAQQQLPMIQGVQNTWFCGAWTGYGFHEDGLRSGELVAEALTEIIHLPAKQSIAA
jgi:predicted NAD/FAD-binding protein